ncbi:hypothetical protein KIN20_016509 [Parelaphostrongylus tenuis]|uniref:Uncharacterized protein n=1 Tax=Parelaphostrongylus tenuis TaxID=148309 RepID=A0AAD5N208_PARTN|nr:hypothetical protein KIN20_016509 [Parelaphostrongylus tenuis]
MDNTSDCGTPDNLIKFERDSDATSEPAVLLDSVEPSCLSVSPPIAGGPQVASGGDASRNDRPVVVDDEVGDSWEDLDDTKLEEQMNALKLEAALRRPMNYSSAPVTTQSSWEPHLLPHVLEAYDVPEYVLAEDVANALATTDFGSAVVKWLERKIVFVVFESERQAREALVFHKHQWLRLRPLSKSPVRVQVKALEIQAQLRPTRSRPKTNVGIARRMVESTLGMRSSVSMEQRKMENKQIADAKGAKKNYVRWDD